MSPAVGLIARADARGLGHITREFFRHVQPAKTLVVEPTADQHTQHKDWYKRSDGCKVSRVQWDFTGQFPSPNMRQWLEGLDVLYTAETFYDWRTVDWATEAGVATVLHANPEFYVRDIIQRHPPTVVWNQSPWRHNTLRPDAVVMPVPVAADRFAPTRRGNGPLKVLHVAGANASHDRNGTAALLAALRHVRQPVDVTIVTQARRPPRVPAVSDSVTVTVSAAHGDYWDMYRGFDVLVLPRRYAGQSLPTQEAMAAGLAVVMTDCPPNDWWKPVIRVNAACTGMIVTPGGKVDTWDACPWNLAETIDMLAVDSPVLAAAKSDGLDWASDNSWNKLLPVYVRALGEMVPA